LNALTMRQEECNLQHVSRWVKLSNQLEKPRTIQNIGAIELT
jgi:hypothetical protein